MSSSASPRVAVLGSSGFVGRAVCAAFASSGITVMRVTAPRLMTSDRTLPELRASLTRDAFQSVSRDLSSQLDACEVVVNAAGVATATGSGDDLFGANALLPGIAAAATPRGARFLHVSSAAVQGRRRVLDETRAYAAFSPYSQAKMLGEQMVAGEGTTFRPTSVHGPGRRVTQSLIRLCSSPAASVAGTGARPTPQVLLQNVAEAIVFTALWPGELPEIVLQPSEGLTTAGLVRVLGGREPRYVPDPLACQIVSTTTRLGRRSGAAAGLARRLEMLWFGQDQADGWLTGKWAPSADEAAWKELRR